MLAGTVVWVSLLAVAATVALVAVAAAVARRAARQRIAPRVLVTELADPTVRALFKQRVSRGGWLVVDDGRPMLAQSSVLRGARDRIYLVTRPGDHGQLHVEVGPMRWEEKWGYPLRAPSISRRLEAFLEALAEKDPSVQVVRSVLPRAAAGEQPRGGLPGRA